MDPEVANIFRKEKEIKKKVKVEYDMKTKLKLYSFDSFVTGLLQQNKSHFSQLRLPCNYISIHC